MLPNHPQFYVEVKNKEIENEVPINEVPSPIAMQEFALVYLNKEIEENDSED